MADWYDPAYYSSSPAENPLGPGTATGKRVVRGTSFFTDIGGMFGEGVSDGIFYRYSSYSRTGLAPEDDSVNIGFRCAAD